MSLKCENLDLFRAQKQIIFGLSFEIKQGQKVGLLGPNGSGKTTLIQSIAGLLPHAGVTWQKQPVNTLSFKKQIGIAPELPPFYPLLTVKEYLAFCGALHGLSQTHIQTRGKQLGRELHLEEVWHTPLQKLSKGYQQLVNLAQSVWHHPPLLLWDEPTANLDPEHIRLVRTFLQSLDATVLLSSHQLSEIEKSCDRILILKKGHLKQDQLLSPDTNLESLYLQAIEENI